MQVQSCFLTAVWVELVCCNKCFSASHIARWAVQGPLAVAQRIVLFCAQHSVQLVVDELMSECAQLVGDDGGGSALEGASERRAQAADLDSVPTFLVRVRLQDSDRPAFYACKAVATLD